MVHPNPIDFSLYLRPPKVGASSAFLLVLRLIKAAPPEPSSRELAALTRMHAAGEQLQRVLRERARLASRNLRAFDSSFDNAWGALYKRLEGSAKSRDPKERERAQALLAGLFPEGLAFLAYNYDAQWAASETLLQRIKAEGFEEELGELASPRFLTHVRDAHAAFAEALGVGQGEVEAAPALAPAISATAQAIANYGRILVGGVDLDDPQSLARFEAAMAPRDALLARQRSRRREGGELEDGEDFEGETSDEAIEDLELPPLPASLEG